MKAATEPGWAQRELDRIAAEVRQLPRYLRVYSAAWIKAQRKPR